MSVPNYLNLLKEVWMALRFMLDPAVPISEKAWIIISLLYFISPVDFIPDPIFGIGILDDFVVILLMLFVMAGKLKKYAESKKNVSAQRHKDDRNTIDVEYEIIDDHQR